MWYFSKAVIRGELNVLRSPSELQFLTSLVLLLDRNPFFLSLFVKKSSTILNNLCLLFVMSGCTGTAAILQHTPEFLTGLRVKSVILFNPYLTRSSWITGFLEIDASFVSFVWPWEDPGIVTWPLLLLLLLLSMVLLLLHVLLISFLFLLSLAVLPDKCMARNSSNVGIRVQVELRFLRSSAFVDRSESDFGLFAPGLTSVSLLAPHEAFFMFV